MSSLNALNVAIEAAERKRDAARTAMQERQRAQQAAQAQMDQLQGYVGEMQARWGAQEGLAVQPEVMHHQYQFMERLQHAIGLQTKVVGDQNIRLETARQALLATEGVTLQFTPDGITRLAQIAADVNTRTENIGARRLATVMERLLDDISFAATDWHGQTVTIDATYVDARLGELSQNEDLSRYIL